MKDSKMKKLALLLTITALGGGVCGAIAAMAAAPGGYLDADQPVSDIPGLDPANVRATQPGDIQWHEAEYDRRAMLWGNPDKPGPYGYLIHFEPGQNSKPHYHDKDRQGFVISGTFWNSASPKEDSSTLRPVAEGSYIHHVAGKVHWDGARTGPVLVLMTGVGPVKTTRIPQN